MVYKDQNYSDLKNNQKIIYFAGLPLNDFIIKG